MAQIQILTPEKIIPRFTSAIWKYIAINGSTNSDKKNPKLNTGTFITYISTRWKKWKYIKATMQPREANTVYTEHTYTVIKTRLAVCQTCWWLVAVSYVGGWSYTVIELIVMSSKSRRNNWMVRCALQKAIMRRDEGVVDCSAGKQQINVPTYVRQL